MFLVHLQGFFYSRSDKLFVSSLFALHADGELLRLKNKLVVTTPLREQILCTSVFKRCEILVEDVVLKANLIPLEMFDFNEILGIDWFSNHRASMDCFTKNIVFKKPRYPDLEFEGDRRILPTYVDLGIRGEEITTQRV